MQEACTGACDNGGSHEERGYATGMVGKWHLGTKAPYWPTHQGFDFFFGVPHSNDMSPFPVLRGEEIVEPEADQNTLTQRFTNEAIGFVHENKERPFFLYFAHHAACTSIHCEGVSRHL